MRMILAALSNRKAAIGLAIVVIIVLMGLIAPLLTDYNPARRVGRPHEEPSATHLMGTTRNGYDVFAQLTHGARTSLAVGFGAGLIITVIGTAVGIAGGYLGGKTDEALNFA
ncbi:MAG TPA: ABC transporter permease, partial [Inquilinus sp.]|nr:ABC transporter permease [Inquilinus sp.]